MKRIIFIGAGLLFLYIQASAQDEEKAEKKKFKENLFTGGSVSLGISNYAFTAGGNPVFGYNIAKWIDAGIVLNYTYGSGRDIYNSDLRYHQSIYGGGVFTKIYPVRFLFVQAQAEHNFIHTKQFYRGTDAKLVTKSDVNSLLVGAGYTTSRYPGSGQPFFYLAVLFDVSGNDLSPYKDEGGRVIPIVRAGIQVPLFQGQHR